MASRGWNIFGRDEDTSMCYPRLSLLHKLNLTWESILFLFPSSDGILESTGSPSEEILHQG